MLRGYRQLTMLAFCRVRLGNGVEASDQFGNVPFQQRPAEQIALYLLNLGMSEHGVELLFGLNAFGNHRHFEIAPQAGDIGQQAQRAHWW